MKKIVTLLFLFSATLFAQLSNETLVYISADKLGFYDFETETNYSDVYSLVQYSNQVYHYNNRFFVVSSGNFNNGFDAVQIFTDNLFAQYKTNQDTMIFRNGVMVIPLESFGNAFTLTAINDSTALVTLAGTGQVQVINYLTGTVSAPISDGVVGNPQGSCDFNSDYIAVAMADWYAGVGNSVRLFNKHTLSFDETIVTRLNTVDVTKLSDGNLLSWSWGTWSGAENYGTLDFINKDSLTISVSIMFEDSLKPNNVLQINDSTIYVNGYLSDFSSSNYLVNSKNYTYQKQTEGFFAKTIVGKLLDNSYVVMGNSGLEIYSADQTLTDSLSWVFPFKWASAVIPPANGIANNSNIPIRFSLEQNYPNPFSKGSGGNPTTTIKYSIPEMGILQTTSLQNVRLEVYDALGRRVATLVNGQKSPGEYSVQFNANDLASGIYFYTLRAGNFVTTKKMILMK